MDTPQPLFCFEQMLCSLAIVFFDPGEGLFNQFIH